MNEGYKESSSLESGSFAASPISGGGHPVGPCIAGQGAGLKGALKNLGLSSLVLVLILVGYSGSIASQPPLPTSVQFEALGQIDRIDSVTAEIWIDEQRFRLSPGLVIHGLSPGARLQSGQRVGYVEGPSVDGELGTITQVWVIDE